MAQSTRPWQAALGVRHGRKEGVCAHSGTTVMCEHDAAGELAVLWLPVHSSCQSTVCCMHMAMRRLGYTPIERRHGEHGLCAWPFDTKAGQ